jgi:hypothetical protein
MPITVLLHRIFFNVHFDDMTRIVSWQYRYAVCYIGEGWTFIAALSMSCLEERWWKRYMKLFWYKLTVHNDGYSLSYCDKIYHIQLTQAFIMSIPLGAWLKEVWYFTQNWGKCSDKGGWSEWTIRALNNKELTVCV